MILKLVVDSDTPFTSKQEELVQVNIVSSTNSNSRKSRF
jgi:hypothetical protein